jgi:nitrate/TMAO reductase-like tetraheme cytochrome c subunit
MKRILVRLFKSLSDKLGRLHPVVLMAVAVVGTVAFVVSGLAAYHTYDYVQHDNDFCMSCHLMEEPFERFANSAHRDLGCKACHQPNPVERAKMGLRQVIANPAEITVHAHVPDSRCTACHLEGEADEWLLVENSRGHELHLNSMEPVLQELECVTCHSSAVHEFHASRESCSQRGCHSDAEVRLAEMAHLELDCGACHDFRAPLDREPGQEDPANLMPTGNQCLSCHEMRHYLQLDPDSDPHGQQCGLCHNAHTQRNSEDAVRSCTGALCHAVPEQIEDDHHQWNSVRLSDCTRCHEAHTFTVNGEDCGSCHSGVIASALPAETPPGDETPIPFRRGVLSGFLGLGGDWAALPTPAVAVVPLAATTASIPTASTAVVAQQAFDHERHRSIECRSCHTTGTSVVRGDRAWCNSCHHSNRSENSCIRCHDEGPAAQIEFPILMHLPGGEEERPLTFPHEGHRVRSCSDCHGTPPGPVATDFSCISCHDEHHETETVRCAQCHGSPARWAHTEPLVHRTCSGGVCHSGFNPGMPSAWTRAVCVACHEDFGEGELPPLPGSRPDTARALDRVRAVLSGGFLRKHP